MTLTVQTRPDQQSTPTPPAEPDTPPASRRTRRVLLTGSRRWPWPTVITRVLDAERARLAAGAVLMVVHGACPQGADAAAAAWCAQAQTVPGARVVEEPHPAQWRDARGQLDRTAGHARNAAMVAAGADLVIAFCLDNSPGTLDCLIRAREAWMASLVHFAYSTPRAEPTRTETAQPPAQPAQPEPAQAETAAPPAQPTQRRNGRAARRTRADLTIAPGVAEGTGRARRRATADEEAEQVMTQGYSPARNPVCPTCHEQTSATGQCQCTA